jgi:hypothetical protein
MKEALAPLYTSVLRNGALFAVAVGLATLAALFLARRTLGPIRLFAGQCSASRCGSVRLRSKTRREIVQACRRQVVAVV